MNANQMVDQCRKKINIQNQLEQSDQEPSHGFFRCAELVLPFLTPQELAAVALSCKDLRRLSKSVALRRSLDAARSLESSPIPFHNTVDGRPYCYFIYTPCSIISSPPYSPLRQPWGSTAQLISRCFEMEQEDAANHVMVVDESGELSSGCHCERCEEISEELIFGCPCTDLDELGLVGECGPSCGCDLDCVNRSTQRGIGVRLKIVKHERKGWGLYAAQFVPKGHFVCEYAGELLTTEEAKRRQQVYDKLAHTGKFSSALLVVREHLPSGKACLRMNIDATRIGNVGRFINHSCDGGKLSITLVRSSGSLLPRLCFFSSKDINENEELTFSYGEIRIRSDGLKCFCGSSCCIGTMPSEHT